MKNIFEKYLINEKSDGFKKKIEKECQDLIKMYKECLEKAYSKGFSDGWNECKKGVIAGKKV